MNHGWSILYHQQQLDHCTIDPWKMELDKFQLQIQKKICCICMIETLFAFGMMLFCIIESDIYRDRPIRSVVVSKWTGAALGEGSGATMSDDEDELQMDFSLDQSGGEGHDLMGFGPLLPTESERTLMERVRQELKIELKQVKPFPCHASKLSTLASSQGSELIGRDSSQESKTWERKY